MGDMLDMIYLSGTIAEPKRWASEPHLVAEMSHLSQVLPFGYSNPGPSRLNIYAGWIFRTNSESHHLKEVTCFENYFFPA
jgi:hypothetical protein